MCKIHGTQNIKIKIDLGNRVVFFTRVGFYEGLLFTW